MTGSWPPPGTVPPPQPRPDPPDGYRSPTRVARLVSGAVVAWMAVAAAALIAGMAQHAVCSWAVSDPGTVSAERLATAERWRLTASRTALLIGLPCLGLVALWTRRLYRNLSLLGCERRFGDGWSHQPDGWSPTAAHWTTSRLGGSHVRS